MTFPAGSVTPHIPLTDSFFRRLQKTDGDRVLPIEQEADMHWTVAHARVWPSYGHICSTAQGSRSHLEPLCAALLKCFKYLGGIARVDGSARRKVSEV